MCFNVDLLSEEKNSSILFPEVFVFRKQKCYVYSSDGYPSLLINGAEAQAEDNLSDF